MIAEIRPHNDLIASILIRAEKDYYYDEDMRSEIDDFLMSGWFEDIVEELELDIDETRKAIVEGWGIKRRRGC